MHCYQIQVAWSSWLWHLVNKKIHLFPEKVLSSILSAVCDDRKLPSKIKANQTFDQTSMICIN